MVFLNPLFLWTLLGLSIPIAIHFWSKKKVKTIKIGSTQLLRELKPKQTKSIRLNQWFLLLLRMLIILLISLILAVPKLEFSKTEKSITYLIEPSLVGMDKVNDMLDTITDHEIRLMASDFPLLGDQRTKIEKTETANYWQLSQQMQSLQTDSLIVLSKGLMSGFKGMRPRLERPIHWLMIDAGTSSISPVEAVLKNDQLELLSMTSDQSMLSYVNESYALSNDNIKLDNKRDSVLIKMNIGFVNLPISQEKPQRILIVYEDQFSAERIYIDSGFKALSTYLKQEIQVSSVKDIQGMDTSSFDVLVWLKQEAVMSFSGKTLVWKPDELSMGLIEVGVLENQFLLRKHLDAENSLDLKLPRQLMIVLDRHPQLAASIQDLDQRTMGLPEIQVNYADVNPSKNSKHQKDISSWLWSLLIVTLPLERILSKYKKQ